MLYAAALGIRSTCTLLHDAIVAGQVVDDEDMLLHIFGFRLDLPGSKAVKKAKAALTQSITSTPPPPPALLSRLNFRRHLLQILELMQPASADTISQAAELCDAACKDLDAFLIDSPSPSNSPQNDKNKTNDDELEGPPPPLGFAPEVHRRAMGLAPPRAINIPPFLEAVKHWKGMLQALGEACRWLTATATWGQLSANLNTFAAAPKNLPIVRSLVHRAIVGPLKASDAMKSLNAAAALSSKNDDSGTITASSSSSSSSPLLLLPPWCPSPSMIAAEFGWSADAPPSPDAAMFLEQCAIATQGWCHTMCLNRCRQRRRLRVLLADWRNMTDHGFNSELSEGVQAWFKQHGWTWSPTDEGGAPVGGPVTAWVEQEAAKTMVAHLMLGLQLDVYAPHEFCGVYWYCDYLIGSGQGALVELHQMRPKVSPPPPPPPPPPPQHQVRKGKNKVKLPTPKQTAADAAALEKEQMEQQALAVGALLTKADRLMCQGMMRLTLGLSWLGLVQPPLAPFNSEKERFHQRFNSFDQLLRPPPLSFDDFKRSTAPGDIGAERVLLAAYEAFVTAQTTIATLEQSDIAGMVSPQQAQHLIGVKRISAQNMMAVRLLMKGVAEQPQPFSVGWDFKIALKHSTALFYPAVVLKSAVKK